MSEAGDGAFTREVRVVASYDYRHDRGDQRGAHGADLVFILSGADGAVTARISTGWVARPLARPVTGPASFALDARRQKPGVDASVRDLYPSGVYVGAHSLLRRKGSVSQDDCDLLPGGKCWGTGGCLIADEVVKTLVTMGSDGVWHQLESYYQEWVEGDPLSDQGDP